MTKTITSPASDTPLRSTMFAIGLVCASSIPFAMLDSTAKYLGGTTGLPVAQIVWIRFIAHVLFTIVLVGPYALPKAFKTNKPAIQVLRSIFLLGATGFNFYALKSLQLDQTVTIFFLAPFVVAALAGPFLGEWVGWRRMAAIMVGFLGVLLVMKPGIGGIKPEFLLAFCAATSYGCYAICTRYLAAHDSSETTLLYSPVAGLIAFAPLAILNWEWPSGISTWILLLSLGASGGFGHWLIIVAHRYAPASTLAPFNYTALLTMTITGYLVFNDIPDRWTLSGAAIVFLAGLYLLYRERETGVAKVVHR